MLITLYIIAWLASGVLGAWIGHKYNDEGSYHTRLGLFLTMAICGGLTLLAAVVYFIVRKVSQINLFDIVIFKGKSK